MRWCVAPARSFRSCQVLRTVPEPSSTNPKLLRKMPGLAMARVEGAVTSIALADIGPRSFTFFVGTAMCNIYKLTYEPATSRWAGELGADSAITRPASSGRLCLLCMAHAMLLP